MGERTSFAFSVDGREGHEGTGEDNHVGERKGKALPVDVEEGG